jgi:hypothetical protein
LTFHQRSFGKILGDLKHAPNVVLSKFLITQLYVLFVVETFLQEINIESIATLM